MAQCSNAELYGTRSFVDNKEKEFYLLNTLESLVLQSEQYYSEPQTKHLVLQSEQYYSEPQTEHLTPKEKAKLRKSAAECVSWPHQHTIGGTSEKHQFVFSQVFRLYTLVYLQACYMHTRARVEWVQNFA